MLQLLRSYLGAETSHRVGAQHTLNAEYFKRIDALNYTMMHDDGQHVDDLEQADVVLVGVSRTSKTPTSIYLANRGVKTGNVPLVPGIAVAPQVEALAHPLVVGLFASPERIVQIRQNRLLGLNAHQDDDQYIDRKAVAEEVMLSRRLCAKHNWPMIDVTRRSIEETAAAMLKLLAERRRLPVVRERWRSWLADEPLVLASRSASRRAVLEAAGIPLEIVPADIDERAIEARGCAGVARHGRDPAGPRQGPGGGGAPARAAGARRRPDPGARRTRRFNKPADRAAAREQFELLRGQTHALHSALALVRDGAVLFEQREIARLTMRAFSDDFLDAYLAAAGRGRDRERRRLSGRGPRHSAVRAHRGRSFHHSGPAAASRCSGRAAPRRLLGGVMSDVQRRAGKETPCSCSA